MTEKTINCADCNVEFTYEHNPKYPRKYCLNCSAKKKAEYEAGPTVDTPVTNTGISSMDIPTPKTNGYKLTEENIRIGALTCASNEATLSSDRFWDVVKEFEEYIRNGK